MKQYTRFLNNVFKQDIVCLRLNNSKTEKRTKEQIIQSINDKSNHYIRKWNGLLNDSETIAQKKTCYEFLKRVEQWQKSNLKFYQGAENEKNNNYT